MPDSSSSEEEHAERLQFKLVLLGDKAVGKTAIAKKLTSAEFEPA